jgi:hypothetical protein
MKVSIPLMDGELIFENIVDDGVSITTDEGEYTITIEEFKDMALKIILGSENV